mmetsp:Transcript_90644/g.142239  ORF Transcript_90644/g.142239 Transcript_90644/m.142239 type:complete len:460 (-) Transcript_90644:54-1433(-)
MEHLEEALNNERDKNQRLESELADKNTRIMECEGRIAELEAELRHVRAASVDEHHQLYEHFAGQWEIRSGKDRSVWGKAVIAPDGAFFQRAKSPQKNYPITLSGTLSGEVKLFSTISEARLEMRDMREGHLSWRLIKLGKPTGLAQWTRLRAVPRGSPRSASNRKAMKTQEAETTFEVAEIITDEDKKLVLQLHSNKAAFNNDRKWLQLRIFSNEDGSVHCRSWALTLGEVIVAAATVRLIPYINRDGVAWAQIMNVSVGREHEGYGTRLVAGLEELLWRERVDVVVLYPVPNNRADRFWATLGYSEREESLLPPEELDPKNNALIPEGWEHKGVRTVLPRWEKMLVRDHSHPEFQEGVSKRRRIEVEAGEHYVDTREESTWKNLNRVNWPLWRWADAEASRIGGEELSIEFEKALQSRRKFKELDAQQRALKGHPSATTNSENSESSRTSVATTNVRV